MLIDVEQKHHQNRKKKKTLPTCKIHETPKLRSQNIHLKKSKIHSIRRNKEFDYAKFPKKDQFQKGEK